MEKGALVNICGVAAGRSTCLENGAGHDESHSKNPFLGFAGLDRDGLRLQTVAEAVADEEHRRYTNPGLTNDKYFPIVWLI